MMDRDFSPTPLQSRLTLASLAVGGVVGLLLFGGVIPGLHPSYTPNPYTTIDGRTYVWSSIPVPIPYPGSSRTLPAADSLHNVTFSTWVTNWSVLGGTYLHGTAAEPNGTVYPFALGGYAYDANWTSRYFAPGGEVAVAWAGGLTAYLYVLI
jgi:hypothetical protein